MTSSGKVSYRGKERRLCLRKRVTLPADIIRVNQMKFKRKWDHEVATDIGLSGLGIKSAKPLPAKANVTVAVLLHNDNTALLTLDAKLVWTRPQNENRHKIYYMGLEFTKLDSEAKDKIQRFVDGTF